MMAVLHFGIIGMPLQSLLGPTTVMAVVRQLQMTEVSIMDARDQPAEDVAFVVGSSGLFSKYVRPQYSGRLQETQCNSAVRASIDIV